MPELIERSIKNQNRKLARWGIQLAVEGQCQEKLIVSRGNLKRELVPSRSQAAAIFSFLKKANKEELGDWDNAMEQIKIITDDPDLKFWFELVDGIPPLKELEIAGLILEAWVLVAGGDIPKVDPKETNL